jgi:hypothetical protein
LDVPSQLQMITYGQRKISEMAVKLKRKGKKRSNKKVPIGVMAFKRHLLM